MKVDTIAVKKGSYGIIHPSAVLMYVYADKGDFMPI